MLPPSRSSFICTAICLLALTRIGKTQQGLDFEGIWVFRFHNQTIFKLVLTHQDGTVTGTLTKPKKLEIDQDGDVREISSDQISTPVPVQKLSAEKLSVTMDGDFFTMALEDPSHALLATEGMHPLLLERVPASATVALARSLPKTQYPESIRLLQAKLRAMVKQDQRARLAFDEASTEAADTRNRAEILRIFRQYGWVTNSLAGKAAASDFWLLVQHQTAEIQQQFLPALEKAARTGDASMSNYAYLYDRVQVGLGKPQHWGSQVVCEARKPVLSPVDDLAGLDARRKELFMLPIEKYLEMDYLVQLCAKMGAVH